MTMLRAALIALAVFACGQAFGKDLSLPDPNPDPSPMLRAPRCQAHSKRNGKQCRSPAVSGKRVCRMHGAAGGAPRGNSNARKYGLYTADAVKQRQVLADLIRTSREMVEMY